jgi:quinol monooxygenase YgiN
MQDQIYTIYHLRLDPANFDAFKTLVETIVAETAKEADASIYEYVVNADKTEVHIVERYHPRGLLPHVEQTFSPFAERFLALATIEKTFAYGETTPEIRAKLDGFGAIYFAPFAGFSR